MAEVFPHYYLFFFYFDHLQEGKSKRAQSWTKSTNFGPSLFHKYSKLDYTTANAILMKLTKIMFLHESKALV